MFLNCSSSNRGLLFSKGTIVDGSFIEAPSSTKNTDKKRDPEMHSAKKGNRWHFGIYSIVSFVFYFFDIQTNFNNAFTHCRQDSRKFPIFDRAIARC